MKTLASMFVLTLALALTGPAFAGDVTKATTQADCEKAGGVWDADNNKGVVTLIAAARALAVG